MHRARVCLPTHTANQQCLHAIQVYGIANAHIAFNRRIIYYNYVYCIAYSLLRIGTGYSRADMVKW